MIKIKTAKADDLNFDVNEVLRYLGYGKSKPDKNNYDEILNCVDEIKKKLNLIACYDKFEIIENDGEFISFANIKTNSKELIKNLKDCDEVIVFTATIGIEVDRIIQRYSMINQAKAVIVQAVGAVYIEAFCDFLCEKLKDEEGKYQRPRFSPGYGDFSLSEQTKIFEILDCHRKIGVGLTQSLLMIPTKSVSAIIGLSEKNSNCKESGCEECDNLRCEYRRN